MRSVSDLSWLLFDHHQARFLAFPSHFILLPSPLLYKCLMYLHPMLLKWPTVHESLYHIKLVILKGARGPFVAFATTD